MLLVLSSEDTFVIVALEGVLGLVCFSKYTFVIGFWLYIYIFSSDIYVYMHLL